MVSATDIARTLTGRAGALVAGVGLAVHLLSRSGGAWIQA